MVKDWHLMGHSSELLIGQVIWVNTLLRDHKREAALAVDRSLTKPETLAKTYESH